MISVSNARQIRLSIVDYALSAVGSSAAMLSVGQSLGRPQLGAFGLIVVLTGLGFSFLMSLARSRRESNGFDAWLYFGLAIVAMFAAINLNEILPEGGFPTELGIVAVLSWMLMLGSWAAWSDSTLLFQAVPCISLFALVGVIELFAGSTFAFFLFLIASAFLYARAHHRTMLRQAAAAGYQDLATIRSGPWKWVAGPEWSIASAFVVVLASLLGAPVIQQSVQGVAGTVKLPMPPMRTPSRSPVGSSVSPTSFRIGTGPRELSDHVVLRAKMEKPRYLRSATYVSYVSGGWSRPNSQTLDMRTADAMRADRSKLLTNGNMEPIQFDVVLMDGAFEDFPAPGEVIQLSPALEWRVRADGTVGSDSNLPLQTGISGQSLVAKSSVPILNAPRPTPEFFSGYVDTTGSTPRVRQLADEVCRSAKTDYEKAEYILAEIGRRCRYNLNAKQVPFGNEAVDYFLFTSHEGYCDLFASSMVLMARTQGIPARLVTGYFPFEMKRDGNGYFPVREADGHAWAELYFEGVGWTPFDATEGAEMAAGGGRGQSTAGEPLLQQGWFRWALGIFLLGLGAMGVGSLVSALKAQLVWSKQEPVALARAYEVYCGALQRVSNRPRRIYETPSEYFGGVIEKTGPLGPDAEGLAQRFELAFYGTPGTAPTAVELEAEARSLAQAFRKRPKAK